MEHNLSLEAKEQIASRILLMESSGLRQNLDLT
jgi:hypothetical protein